MVIVTGLPRSGTSMMMKMLEAGGIAVITDRQRKAQKVMLARKGERPRAEDDEMKQLYLKHLSEIETWLAERKNVKILYINYEEVVKQPLETSINIQNFLGRSLNIDNMINSVDPTLYRQRSAGITADIQEKEP